MWHHSKPQLSLIKQNSVCQVTYLPLRLFTLRGLTNCSFSLAVVEVEGVIVVVVRFDGVQIQQDVVKLLEQEETGGHALSTRYCVTLTCRPANQLQWQRKFLQVKIVYHKLAKQSFEPGFTYCSELEYTVVNGLLAILYYLIELKSHLLVTQVPQIWRLNKIRQTVIQSCFLYCQYKRLVKVIAT